MRIRKVKSILILICVAATFNVYADDGVDVLKDNCPHCYDVATTMARDRGTTLTISTFKEYSETEEYAGRMALLTLSPTMYGIADAVARERGVSFDRKFLESLTDDPEVAKRLATTAAKR